MVIWYGIFYHLEKVLTSQVTSMMQVWTSNKACTSRQVDGRRGGRFGGKLGVCCDPHEGLANCENLTRCCQQG